MAELFRELATARVVGSLGQALLKLSRVGLLVLCDFAMAPLKDQERRDFLEYFGLKSKGWYRFLWLDVEALSRNLLKADQELVRVKYFTSRVGSPPDKVKRQTTYLDAVATLPGVDTRFGH